MSPAATEILTERLRLSCWQESDAEELREILDRCDAHLRPWIPFMQHEPRSLADTRQVLTDARAAFAKAEHHRYAIRERSSGVLVGETMLIGRGGPNTLEAGYWLDQRHCGVGYATEATRVLLPLAFETLGVERVILRCDERNLGSIRVAERLGATQADVETLVENNKITKLRVFVCHAPRP